MMLGDRRAVCETGGTSTLAKRRWAFVMREATCPKPRSHLLDVYGCWLHVATDRRQLATLRRQHGEKSIPKVDAGWFGGTTRFRTEPSDGPDVNHYVIYINLASHRGDTAAIVDTCAHEATHTAALILDSTSAEYDGDSEPLAWLVGWVTRWLYEAAT